MTGVQRPPIGADIGAKTARLDKPLRGVVAAFAETHERAEPEFVDIAVMRFNVVADCRRLDDAALEAEHAQRVREQLVPSGSAPNAALNTTCPTWLAGHERPSSPPPFEATILA
jgi:hypothetical protein